MYHVLDIDALVAVQYSSLATATSAAMAPQCRLLLLITPHVEDDAYPQMSLQKELFREWATVREDILTAHPNEVEGALKERYQTALGLDWPALAEQQLQFIKATRPRASSLERVRLDLDTGEELAPLPPVG